VGERSWLRGLVGSGEDEMRGVEMETVAWQVGQVEGLGGHRGQDGVALAEEGVEGSTEAVVVEAVGGGVPEEISSALGGPGEGGTLMRAVGGQSRGASRRLRTGPWEKASCGSGGRCRSMMVATSSRCKSGAMRARGPRWRVSSVRVGPCQACAMTPPGKMG